MIIPLMCIIMVMTNFDRNFVSNKTVRDSELIEFN